MNGLLVEDQLPGPSEGEPIEFAGMENLNLASTLQQVFRANWLLGNDRPGSAHLLPRFPRCFPARRPSLW